MFRLSQNGSQTFCPQKISEKWKIKVYEVSSVPPCCISTLGAAVRCFWLCSVCVCVLVVMCASGSALSALGVRLVTRQQVTVCP